MNCQLEIVFYFETFSTAIDKVKRYFARIQKIICGSGALTSSFFENAAT